MKIRIGRIEQAFAVLLVLYFVLSFFVHGGLWFALLKYCVLVLGAVAVIRISHDAVRTLGNQAVPFNQTRGDTPFLAQRLSGSKREQRRSNRQHENDHE